MLVVPLWPTALPLRSHRFPPTNDHHRCRWWQFHCHDHVPAVQLMWTLNLAVADNVNDMFDRERWPVEWRRRSYRLVVHVVSTVFRLVVSCPNQNRHHHGRRRRRHGGCHHDDDRRLRRHRRHHLRRRHPNRSRCCCMFLLWACK